MCINFALSFKIKEKLMRVLPAEWYGERAVMMAFPHSGTDWGRYRFG